MSDMETSDIAGTGSAPGAVGNGAAGAAPAGAVGAADALRAAGPGGARSPRPPGWQPFRSLSVAMFHGFVRDRAAMFFTILFPVL
ncbi:MAG: hypothetical protein J2P35_14675, partial [Actinobacteria bacterium]|nr:hypothetical protein [Actinomycetota bacterium]